MAKRVRRIKNNVYVVCVYIYIYIGLLFEEFLCNVAKIMFWFVTIYIYIYIYRFTF